MHEQLAAVVEPDLRLEELQQDDNRLLHAVLVHDRVIRELFQQTTVLPSRFTTFPTLDELQKDLQSNQNRYLEALSRLDEKAELTLKFIPHEFEERPISTNLKGKEYFLAKKQQHHIQQQQKELQSQELTQVLQAIAAYQPISVQSDSTQIHILISQDDQSSIKERITQIVAQTSQWSCSFGELLPPFHFTETD